MNRNLPLAEVYFHRRGQFGRAERWLLVAIAASLPIDAFGVWLAVTHAQGTFLHGFGLGVVLTGVLGVGGLYRLIRGKVGELYRLSVDSGALRITPQAGGEATVIAPGAITALRYGKKAVKEGNKQVGNDTIVEITTASAAWKLLAQDTDIADLETRMSDVEKANPDAKVQYVLGA